MHSLLFWAGLVCHLARLWSAYIGWECHVKGFTDYGPKLDPAWRGPGDPIEAVHETTIFAKSAENVTNTTCELKKKTASGITVILGNRLTNNHN